MMKIKGTFVGRLLCRCGIHHWIDVVLHWETGPGFHDRQCDRCGILDWECVVGRPPGRKIVRITRERDRRSEIVAHNDAEFV